MQEKDARSSHEFLAGIEAMRGFAAFGVIVIHSGLVVDHRTTPATAAMRDVFNFVVPFFLVTSFFFAIRGEEKKSYGWSAWLRSRFLRLGLPYAFWSLIYLGLRMGMFYLEHQGNRTGELLQDPYGLLLNGGSSVALYFLPLVFTGLIIIHAFRHFLCRSSTGMLWISLILGTAANQLLIQTGNSFDLSSARGFESLLPGLNMVPPARLFLALLAEGVRCLPLIFAAALAVRLLPVLPRSYSGIVFMIGMVLYLVGSYANYYVVVSFPTELSFGVGVFLVGWSLSQILRPNNFLFMIGSFSFGVYLVHQVVLEAMRLVVLHLLPHDMSPVGLTVILTLSAAAYFISMTIVAVANRCGPWMRAVFAVRS